jgi:hypothetical protein
MIHGCLPVCVGALLTIAPPAPAQSIPADASAGATAAAPQPAPKKKGLFGKMKDAANSKMTKTVAKTVACTMVPGGQVIAGAIDAADVASGDPAAGAASAATGSACVPGAPGSAGGSVEAQSSDLGAAAGVLPMDMGALRAMTGLEGGGETGMAECLGLSEKDYQAYIDPTGGEARAPTNKEMKRQAKIAKKVDVTRHQACAQQQARTQTGAR